MKTLAQFSLLLALVGGFGQVSHADILYVGANFGGSQTLWTVDTNSPGTPTSIGNMGGGSFYGLGDYNGRLFSFNQTADTVVEINAANGSILNSTALGFNETGEGTIAFRSDGKGFLTSSAGGAGRLLSFDIGVAGATLIDANLAPSMDGSDFSSADVLFAIAQTSGDLYTIDTSNGNTMLIGPTGINPGVLAGLAFGPSGLFAITQNGLLFSINPLNGNSLLLGSTGLTDVFGLTSLQAQAVPEPASLALWGLGSCIGLIAVRRRAKSKKLAF